MRDKTCAVVFALALVRHFIFIRDKVRRLNAYHRCSTVVSFGPSLVLTLVSTKVAHRITLTYITSTQALQIGLGLSKASNAWGKDIGEIYKLPDYCMNNTWDSGRMLGTEEKNPWYNNTQGTRDGQRSCLALPSLR